MDMGIIEARRDQTPAGIDDGCRRPGQGPGLRIVSDGQDAVAGDG
jgi:hypothetical protein